MYAWSHGFHFGSCLAAVTFSKMTSDRRFFILTRRPDELQHISAGQICHTSTFKHNVSSSQKTLSVTFVGRPTSLPYDVEAASLEELSEAEAELLLALPDDAERLKWFRRRDSLRAALELQVGMVVNVERAGEQLRGIIRHIGRRAEPPGSAALPGMFFGIELQVRLSGLRTKLSTFMIVSFQLRCPANRIRPETSVQQEEGEGKRGSNGSSTFEPSLNGPKSSGISVPFSRVRPVIPGSSAPSVPLSAGDRVTYFLSDACRHGMVLGVKERSGQTVVQISTVSRRNPRTLKGFVTSAEG